MSVFDEPKEYMPEDPLEVATMIEISSKPAIRSVLDGTIRLPHPRARW